MTTYKLISADSHIVEPPDLYTSRIEPRFRDRAPRMERLETPTGRKYDAWVIDGQQVGTLGAVMQAGQRFEDPSQIDFLGTWEDVRLGGYDPQAMVKENEMDGVWGSCLQPSQGLFWYRIPDSALLSAICRVYNDWIADFCKPYPDRLKGIAMLNVDDVEEASQELERCAKLGLVGAFIPVSPLADRPYRHPIYDRLWWTAQDLGLPLLLHIGTPRGGVPGCEFTMNLGELTGAGRSTTDYWVRYSLAAMIFAGVFDRYPQLKVGSVEHEAAWIPHWLKQMDFTYRERPVVHQGLAVARTGCCPATTGAATCSWSSWRTISASSCATDRRGDDAVGQRLPARGVDVAEVAGLPRPHVHRRARARRAQDHLGERRADVRLQAELGRSMSGSRAASRRRRGARGPCRGPRPTRRLRAGGPASALAPGRDDAGSPSIGSEFCSRTSTVSFYALRDACGHRQMPLSKGRLGGPRGRVPAALRDVRRAHWQAAERARVGGRPDLRGAGEGRHGVRQASPVAVSSRV